MIATPTPGVRSWTTSWIGSGGSLAFMKSSRIGVSAMNGRLPARAS